MASQHWQSAIARELCQITGTRDPLRAVQQLVQTLLDDAEVAAPPVNLHLLASFQKIRDIQEAVMPHAGRLLPDGANYLIQVNAHHSSGKQRFTAGHEIGHTLIPSFQRHPRVIQDMFTGLFEAGQEEEYLCDVAGAELLLPERLFRPRATNLGCHLNGVIELAHAFQASREATARRMVEMNLWPCAFAIWHLSYKDSEAHINQQWTLGGPEWTLPEKKLRVRYAVSNPLFGRYLHRHLAAPQDGCLMRCFKEGGVVCDEERLVLQNRDMTFYVMAAARNYTDKSGPTRDVFSLLLSDDSPRPAQGNQWEAWTLLEE
jgi:Zn-dependent peptidase ImmA (M78 family)